MANAPTYEPGRYWGRITRQQLGQTSNGNPQFVLSFLIVGKVNPADPEGDLLAVPQQYERSVYRVITEKTTEYLLQDLEVLGFTGESFAALDENNSDCCDLRGTELAFTCTHEFRQAQDETGKWVNTKDVRERWSIARDSTGPKVEPLTAKDVKKLDAMFGRALKQSSAAVKAAENPVEKPPEAKTEPTIMEEAAAMDSKPEDDIPF